jgi:hypothetical protein
VEIAHRGVHLRPFARTAGGEAGPARHRRAELAAFARATLARRSEVTRSTLSRPAFTGSAFTWSTFARTTLTRTTAVLARAGTIAFATFRAFAAAAIAFTAWRRTFAFATPFAPFAWRRAFAFATGTIPFTRWRRLSVTAAIAAFAWWRALSVPRGRTLTFATGKVPFPARAVPLRDFGPVLAGGFLGADQHPASGRHSRRGGHGRQPSCLRHRVVSLKR